MSIKLLLIGDRHNSEYIPSNRKDDFISTCKLKDEEIIQIAKDNNVSAILHPGDFWTDADHKIKNEFISEVANKWNNIFNNDGKKIPLVGIVGNHDLIGENLLSFSNSTTGLLSALNIFKIVSKEEPYVIKDNEREIVITGSNYHKGMDKPEFIDDYIIDKKQGDVHIHIVHGMLSEKDLGKLIRHTKIDNIVNTEADVTFCGHDHIGFGVIKNNNKLFINPGAVVRLTNDLKEVNRDVSVVLLTINDDCTIDTKIIKLNSALPGEEVLDRSITELKKENSKYIEMLKQQVDSMGIDSGLELSDIIDDICNEDKIDDEIKDSIKKSIESKKVSKVAKPVAPKNTNIKKLELVNFQSHKHSVFDFDSNFNVLVGESRQGKSSVLRAIRWILENKPSGDRFIRIGETECSASITLENGTIIERYIRAKDKGYKIYLPDGTVEEGNTKMVSRVQELCGYNYLDVDKTTSIPLNMLKQGDSWYLIGDGYSSTDRARILGSMKDTTAADLVIQDFEKESKEITSQIKNINIDLANSKLELEDLKNELVIQEKKKELFSKLILIEKIKNYQILTEELKEKEILLNKIESELDLDLLNTFLGNIERKLEDLNNVNRHIDTITKETEKIHLSNNIISKISDMKKEDKIIVELNEKIKNLNNCISLINKIKIETENILKQENILNKLGSFDDKKISLLKDKVFSYETIYNALLSISKNLRTIQAAEKFINACSKIDNEDMIINTVNSHLEKINKIKDYLKIYETNQKQVSEISEKLRILDKEYQEKIEDKVKLLIKSGTCPTCYSNISQEQSENIINQIKGED